jgi:hypothetical protein
MMDTNIPIMTQGNNIGTVNEIVEPALKENIVSKPARTVVSMAALDQSVASYKALSIAMVHETVLASRQ